ncbi:hypothetical protein B4U80_12321, partial [Leptotrombidium deliense]
MNLLEEVCVPIVECIYNFEKYDENDNVIAEAIEWGKKLKIISNDYETTDNCVYYAPNMPGSSFKERLLLSKSCLFAFAVDDLCDNLNGNEKFERIINIYECSLFALREHEIHTSDNNRTDPFENAVIDIATDFKPYLENDTALKMKVERELTLYFEAMKMERKASKKNMALKLAEYEVYRHFTVGTNTVVGICNLLISHHVSNEMQCAQLYDLTFASFNKIVYVYNDLVSFEKDIKETSTSNLIIVLKQERKYDKWQDAIDEVVKMLKEELKNFEMLAKLISFDDGCALLV